MGRNKPDTDHDVESVSPTQLEEGDEVLWGDRKTPCEVTDVTKYEDKAFTSPGYATVETPRGNERELRLHRSSGRNPANETDKPFSVTIPDKPPGKDVEGYVWEFWKVIEE